MMETSSQRGSSVNCPNENWPFLVFKDRWLVKGARWHVTGDRWQVPNYDYITISDKSHLLRTTWHLDNQWDIFEAAICDLAMFLEYFPKHWERFWLLLRHENHWMTDYLSVKPKACNTLDCTEVCDNRPLDGTGCPTDLFLQPDVSRAMQWSTGIQFTELQCTKQDCTWLHCTALHCTALHLHCTCTALALHCTALHCSPLHCTALHCTALFFTTLHCTLVYHTLQNGF